MKAILLPNPDFLGWLLDAIGRARREIVLVNYLATLSGVRRNDPVSEIARALEAARRRGVCVTVVLEGQKFRENYDFYRFLKDAGCDVWMDTSLTFIHMKAILIDGTLCVGSHNLTASALTSHEELALATDSGSAVRRFRRELDRVTEQRRSIRGTSGRGAGLPAGAMDALVRIKRALSRLGYILYLLLLRLDRGRPADLKVDPIRWAAALALPPSVASDRVRIWNALDFLERKTKLVKLNRRNGTVRRSALKADRLKIILPDAFWTYGWNARLSVEAIHLYLAGERERQTSPFAPWWRLTRDGIARRYGFQKQLVNRAMRELKRFGLMEVLDETASSAVKRYIRYRNYFRQNPFYDYDARAAQISSLRKRHGKRCFDAAFSIADALDDVSDPRKLDLLAGLIGERGVRSGAEVLAAIRKLSPNSTRRTLEYAIELLVLLVTEQTANSARKSRSFK